MNPSASAPLASVIVPTWNGRHLLEASLASLCAQSYRPLEVILADGHSTDGSVDFVRQRFPDVRVVEVARNRGFAGNVNAGIRAARGEVLLLFNNDAQAEPTWVAECAAALTAHPDAGSVASKVLFADRRTLNSAGDGLTRGGQPFQRGNGQPDGPEWDTARPVLSAMGGAAAYRRAMLEDVGLLDETYYMYLEDLDLGFRAQLRGWGCWYVPTARVYHLGSASGGGPLASYYNGRNLVRLLVKNLPDRLLWPNLPAILRTQVERARAAAAAWRGAAARATLRGQIAGIRELPGHLAARRAIQANRRVSDRQIADLLSVSAA